jgi:hypothetical protein
MVKLEGIWWPVVSVVGVGLAASGPAITCVAEGITVRELERERGVSLRNDSWHLYGAGWAVLSVGYAVDLISGETFSGVFVGCAIGAELLWTVCQVRAITLGARYRRSQRRSGIQLSLIPFVGEGKAFGVAARVGF